MASAQTLTITLEMENPLADQLTERLRGSRETAMTLLYGEACTKATAAKLINVTTRTVHEMIRDGRLKAACGGERVDVRSLAVYVENRGEHDHEARMEKKRRRYA